MCELKKCRYCKTQKPDTEEFWYVTNTLGKFLSGVCKECEDNKPVNTKNWPGRKTWDKMMRRCYDPKDSSWSAYGKVGVDVAEDFKSFENFSKWYQEHYISGWELDKDILGNGTRYSKEVCCYVPDYINSFFCFKKKVLKPKPYGRKFKIDVQLGTNKTTTVISGTPEDCLKQYFTNKDERMKELFTRMLEDYNSLSQGSESVNNIDSRLIELLGNFSTEKWFRNYLNINNGEERL